MQVDVFLEELDCVEPSQLAAVVGRQQPPLEAGGSARQPALPRLLAVAQASAAIIGLLDSPDKARSRSTTRKLLFGPRCWKLKLTACSGCTARPSSRIRQLHVLSLSP